MAGKATKTCCQSGRCKGESVATEAVSAYAISLKPDITLTLEQDFPAQYPKGSSAYSTNSADISRCFQKLYFFRFLEAARFFQGPAKKLNKLPLGCTGVYRTGSLGHASLFLTDAQSLV